MANLNPIIHKITIRDREFHVSLVGNGPYVSEVNGKGVAIGRGTSIVPLKEHSSSKKPFWAVANSRRQVIIDLSGFTEAEIKRFTLEMGVPFEGMDFESAFRTSKAFTYLVKWAKKHSSTFEQYGIAGESISWTIMVNEELKRSRTAERVTLSYM